MKIKFKKELKESQKEALKYALSFPDAVYFGKVGIIF